MTTERTRRTPLARIAIAALIATTACLLATPEGAADVIRLKTGMAVKGTPVQEESDEKTLVVEDYLTGGKRRFVWDVVAKEDYDRLWTAWGWADKTQRIIAERV